MSVIRMEQVVAQADMSTSASPLIDAWNWSGVPVWCQAVSRARIDADAFRALVQAAAAASNQAKVRR